MKAIWLGVCSLLVSLPVRAECGGPYSAQDLLGAYQTVQFMLASGDEQAVIDSAIELEAGLPCLSEKVPGPFFAGVYRVLGAASAMSSNEENATKWFLTARELDATSGFGVDELPFDSPVRALFEAAIAEAGVPPRPVPGKVLSPPENSMVMIDGRPLRVAAATPDRFHLVQLAWLDGRIRKSWLVEGNRLPQILLQDGAPAEEVSQEETRAAKPEKPNALETIQDDEGMPVGYEAADFVRIERDRPRWKTPSLVSGSVAVAGSLVLYGFSFQSRGQFEAATTEADLYHYQQLTNRLSAASSALFLLGGATVTWGVLLGESSGIGIHLPW